ncbi:NAD(P)H:quinone oxidoreductase [Sphaerisporangium corydalis]|uniref:NAD(P)H:quinone oxidoreductase n=1 Tax=Sphaerisporangium corydalis TaxID=1441875 RepID=A0ABV9E5U1_9ACTN|nr:NAD(P)H:quinone oxidoreductase [Sphaerisporangium corydalis]
MTVKVAVIYYSATGTVHTLAQAVAEGAASAGAVVRLRRVAELAPAGAIDQDPRWRRHADAAASIAEASAEDLAWADAYAFGTPTRFGTPAAPLKQFIDQAGGLWREGRLAGKPATAFTSAFNRHGGNEATILSLGNVFYHWGSLIVPPGFTDPAVYAAGGNPYGTSFVTGPAGEGPDTAALEAARYQGRRLAEITVRLQGGDHPTDATTGDARGDATDVEVDGEVDGATGTATGGGNVPATVSATTAPAA